MANSLLRILTLGCTPPRQTCNRYEEVMGCTQDDTLAMQHSETPIYINVHQPADFGGSSSHGQAFISSVDSGSREYQLADPGHMLYNGSRSAATAIALSDEEFEEVGCHDANLDCMSFQHLLDTLQANYFLRVIRCCKISTELPQSCLVCRTSRSPK